MTTPLPEDKGAAVRLLAGPRYRPAAYPLLDLAKAAVHGHAEIAERVKEHQQLVLAEIEQRRQLHDAVSAAEPGAAEPGA